MIGAQEALTTREKITSNIEKYRGSKFKIGLCHGCFDFIHFGHILHFMEAKSKCDFLIASITTDKFVNKGPGRPIFPIDRRLLVISQIRSVNAAYESLSTTAIDELDFWRPDYYFKGGDYANNKIYNPAFNYEKEYAETLGTKVYLTSGDRSSSTYLVNRLKEVL